MKSILFHIIFLIALMIPLSFAASPSISSSSMSSDIGYPWPNATLMGNCSATDSDGDNVSYDARWYVNGTLYYEFIPDSISTRDSHTCGILTNGSAYCWGAGEYGKLGYGSTGNQNNPIAVNISSTFKSISAGSTHTCGILTNGSAYCWGDGSYGRLGNGGTSEQDNPVAVNISSTFKYISAGGYHTCGILTNGSAYCWGNGDGGILGYGTVGNQYNPIAVNTSSTFKSISLGRDHTCGILTNGSAYCWGYGSFGMLGYGGTNTQYNPIAVNVSALTVHTFKFIASSYSHTCGILTNGSAYCWGAGGQGRLGYGSTGNQYNPIAVNISSTFKSISSTGDYHTCGILTNGSAYCWGYGGYGMLGYGGTSDQYNPIEVNISSTFKSISAGGYHTCGILTNGSAYCWGYGGQGRLGYGSTGNQYNPIAVNTAGLSSPKFWPFFTQGISNNIDNITYGLQNSQTWNFECSASDNDTYSSWMNSTNYIIDNITPTISGIDVNSTSINIGQSVRFNATVTDDNNVSAVKFTIQAPYGNINITATNDSSSHFFVICNQNNACKTNQTGQYNLTSVWANDTSGNTATNETTLKNFTFFGPPDILSSSISSNTGNHYFNSIIMGNCSASTSHGDNVSYDARWYVNYTLYYEFIPSFIETGQYHTCGILTNGSAYCWGSGEYGKLGYGSTSQQTNPYPVNVSALTVQTFKSISAGYAHTCGILTNGSVYCWGLGVNGQLGYGSTGNQTNPYPVNVSALTVQTFKSISTGDSHTCGILTNGSAYCWGYAASGQLGYGGTSEQDNPIAVNISSTFKSISAGSTHTCGILTNGSAYCWGAGSYGRLGYGSTGNQNNPIAVNISSTFKSISAGSTHTCGILTNGSAYCWGAGGQGRLGYGSTGNQYNPIAVNIFSTFKFISTGDSHTCGILTNGSAYCWGDSGFGQLGYGGTSEQDNPYPVNVSALTVQTFKSISASIYHSCGILTNGSAYCWGSGEYGKLGYGGTSQQNNSIAVNTTGLSSPRFWPFYTQGTSVNVDNTTYGLDVGQTWNFECSASDNDTYSSWLNSSDFEILPNLGNLIASITWPTSTINVIQNRTFMINASVTCSGTTGSSCGNVSGRARYNLTSSAIDVDINKSNGEKPLFTPSGNPKNCGAMIVGDICNLSWIANATGNIGEAHSIAVLFESNESIANNQTQSKEVDIIDCTTDVTLSFSRIIFGNATNPVVPNSFGNEAVNNSQNFYTITINLGSCVLDIYGNASSMKSESSNQEISPGNLSFNNQSNEYSSSTRMSSDYQKIFSSIAEGITETIWFWLDMPPVYYGNYTGNLSIISVKNGESPV